jgi:2-polyprenyl-6-methoxyphenol hydroxylase-like FAD-dependent oxidoreductase
MSEAQTVVSHEETDAVVVGCRPAGAATSIALARRGVRVIALDRSKFPSDTLSTHVMFATGIAELKWLGALDRVRAVGAPAYRVIHPNTVVFPGGERLDPHAAMSPVDGIDYGLCTRRPGLDNALVETARDAGAEVREGCRVVELVRDGERVVGVRYATSDGQLHELRAKLVVGADGHHSTVARLLGVEEPYRGSPAGRGLVFIYVKDPRGPEDRQIIQRWQHGETAGFFFPCDDETALALFMPPREEIAEFRRDFEAMWQRKLEDFPELKERLEGCEQIGKPRSSNQTDAYFRTSSGPGWALVGDAGHFKDPVIAQGIRDALRFGRLLGEAVADTVSDPQGLDRRLFEWELRRDRECLPSYYLAQRETRTHPINQLETEMFRELHDNTAVAGHFVEALADKGIHDEFIDVVARRRDPRMFFTAPRLARWAWRAARRPGADRRALAREVLDELRYEVCLRRDLAIVRSGRRADWRALSPGTGARRAATPAVTSSGTAQGSRSAAGTRPAAGAPVRAG